MPQLPLNESQLRIIAGSLRSRKIIFADNNELRPTSDRVRETLFNWLMPSIKDAKVLDLFAGSGILCFESVSRGAKLAVAVEKNKNSCAYITKNIEKLKVTNVRLINSDAVEWLEAITMSSREQPGISSQQFDIIFLDPPYKSNLLLYSINKVVKDGILKLDGLIYFEWNNEVNLTELPSELTILHTKRAGQVYYYLAQRHG